MSIGAFAQRTRLSPKALRLYDELGLLTPARVDDSSGYRFYDASQLEPARLVAALRRLDMPLAEIKSVLEPGPAADRIAAHWASVESEHGERRKLAAYLVDRISGTRLVMYEVNTREIPARSLLCLKRNVHGNDGAWAFGKEFVALMQSHKLPRLELPAGATFCIWWSEISEDSDGPLEWCRPVPEDRARELAEGLPELALRTEPAHREAFVDVGYQGEAGPAEWQLVSDSLRTWAEEHHARPIDLGMRINYVTDGSSNDKSKGPRQYFAVPFDG